MNYPYSKNNIIMKPYFKYLLLLLTILILWNCTSGKKEINIEATKIFNQLKNSDTSIDFLNILTENDTINYFTYSYIYMGGGVSVGDINNDGLPDLYFTGNQVSNKLYLNKGNLQFEDITDKAGVPSPPR